LADNIVAFDHARRLFLIANVLDSNTEAANRQLLVIDPADRSFWGIDPMVAINQNIVYTRSMALASAGNPPMTGLVVSAAEQIVSVREAGMPITA
jgi:hypothetical protein